MEDVPESHKLAARSVFEVWNGADTARFDQVVSPDVVHHDPHDPHASEGLAGLKRTIELNRQIFPDLKIRVRLCIADTYNAGIRQTF